MGLGVLKTPKKKVEMNLPKIYVDADACPVRDIISRTSAEDGLCVVYVASIGQEINPLGHEESVVVDKEKQAADIYIINAVGKNDIVVTDDYGLASLVLSKKAYPISSRGKRYYENDISQLLEQRHISAKLRRAGKKTKGPKRLTKEDKQLFEEKLIYLIKKVKLAKDSADTE